MPGRGGVGVRIGCDGSGLGPPSGAGTTGRGGGGGGTGRRAGGCGLTGGAAGAGGRAWGGRGARGRGGAAGGAACESSTLRCKPGGTARPGRGAIGGSGCAGSGGAVGAACTSVKAAESAASGSTGGISATGAGAGLAILTRRGGPSEGAAGLAGSGALATTFFPLVRVVRLTDVSANLAPPGRVTPSWRATRSVNWRATTSSIELDALFISIP